MSEKCSYIFALCSNININRVAHQVSHFLTRAGTVMMPVCGELQWEHCVHTAVPGMTQTCGSRLCGAMNRQSWAVSGLLVGIGMNTYTHVKPEKWSSHDRQMLSAKTKFRSALVSNSEEMKFFLLFSSKDHPPPSLSAFSPQFQYLLLWWLWYATKFITHFGQKHGAGRFWFL